MCVGECIQITIHRVSISFIYTLGSWTLEWHVPCKLCLTKFADNWVGIDYSLHSNLDSTLLNINIKVNYVTCSLMHSAFHGSFTRWNIFCIMYVVYYNVCSIFIVVVFLRFYMQCSTQPCTFVAAFYVRLATVFICIILVWNLEICIIF